MIDNVPPCIQLGIVTSTQGPDHYTFQTFQSAAQKGECNESWITNFFADKEYWGRVQLLEDFCRHFEMLLWNLGDRKKLGLCIWRCPNGATQDNSSRSYMECGYWTMKLLLIRLFSYLQRKAVSCWRKENLAISNTQFVVFNITYYFEIGSVINFYLECNLLPWKVLNVL